MNPNLALILDELVTECKAFEKAVSKLKAAKTLEAYEEAEDELYTSISHLRVHSEVLEEESLEKFSKFEARQVAA